MTVHFDDHAEMTEWAKIFLQKLGYSIAPPAAKWLTLKQFCLEEEIAHNSLWRLMQRPDAPGFPVRRSETGRILHLQPTQPLREFVNQHKRKPTTTRLLSEIVKS